MKDDTRLVHAGRHPEEHHGAVNPPVYHASTITFPSRAAFDRANAEPWDSVRYGRMGTPTTFAFEEAMSALEGAGRTVACPSGMGAITNAVLCFVEAGSHVLMPDCVYGPTRQLCDKLLKSFGVETTYYDPTLGPEDLGGLVRDETTLIYMEAPGSLTFEMQDVPGIAAMARERGIATAIDTTWASPYFFKPMLIGVDAAVQACTKYIVGHSDAMLGTLTVREEHFDRANLVNNFLGGAPGPDDIYLGLRGLRTLGVRLKQHEKNAIQVAVWLDKRPEILRVLYPALPDDPGHAIWKRDFAGASGLFGVIFEPVPEAAVTAFIESLTYFGFGASFGGYESLVLRPRPDTMRTATHWDPETAFVRLHVGLEDPEDLITDLEHGLDALREAAGRGG